METQHSYWHAKLNKLVDHNPEKLEVIYRLLSDWGFLLIPSMHMGKWFNLLHILIDVYIIMMPIKKADSTKLIV